MATIKTMDRIKDKWNRASQAAQTDYQNGVQDSTVDWAAVTAAAEKAYTSGVQNAIQRGSFKKGVTAAGTSKWKTRTVTVGPRRWAEGISNAVENYERGFTPYREVIQATALPARGARGDVGNIKRVEVIATALHNKRLALKG